jgi:magnesium chelatase subunit D
VDEINLLSAHLGDALLDASSSGVNVVEREGFSASHAAEFVLLGSMNPEEGSLRPQLLDRFALAVDVTAPLDAATRQSVVERRIAFEKNPETFTSQWLQAEKQLRIQVNDARARHSDVVCSPKIQAQISAVICDAGVRSLRADLAVVRAAIAYAALLDEIFVSPAHVSAVLPLALAHRKRDRVTPPPPPQPPKQRPEESPLPESTSLEDLKATGASRGSSHLNQSRPSAFARTLVNPRREAQVTPHLSRYLDPSSMHARLKHLWNSMSVRRSLTL